MRKRSQEEVYGIVGLGRFGFAVARELAISGAEVLCVDSGEETVREARLFTENALVANDLSMSSLRQMGFGECSTVIVCIGGKIDVSLLTVLNLVNLGVPHVIAKAVSEDHGALLEKIGAEVVYPERDMGIRLAKRLKSSSVLESINLSADTDISEVALPSRLAGKTVVDSGIRKKYGLNIIAIRRGKELITQVLPGERLRGDDVLLLIGKNNELERFLEENQ